MDLREVLYKIKKKYYYNEIDRKNVLKAIQEKSKDLEELHSKYNYLNEQSSRFRSKIYNVEKLISEFKGDVKNV